MALPAMAKPIRSMLHYAHIRLLSDSSMRQEQILHCERLVEPLLNPESPEFEYALAWAELIPNLL